MVEETQNTTPNEALRRRDLLPKWIKVFVWIFLIFGALMPVAILLAMLNSQFQMALYGIETNQPRSLEGVFLMCLFSYKFLVAYGLWYEKKWAVNLAIVDAIFGIVVCGLLMFYPLFNTVDGLKFNFRLEWLALIPYLMKMIKIRGKWEILN